MHRADFFDLEPLQIMGFLKEQFPPEAEVRGSNPLGRATVLAPHPSQLTEHVGNDSVVPTNRLFIGFLTQGGVFADL